MADDSTWLSLGEVIARLRAAGFTESESTVRRMVDDGEIESYRVERRGGRRGHRRMRAASVDALIAERRQKSMGGGDSVPNLSPNASEL